MKVLVKNARLGFFDGFKPRAIKGGDAVFSANLICSDETTLIVKGKEVPHEKMDAVVTQVCKDKWGKVISGIDNWVYNKADGSTTRKPQKNEDGEYYNGYDEDSWFIVAKKKPAKLKGGVLPIMDGQKQLITEAEGKIFSGCYVNAIIDVYAMENDGKLVTASLEGVQLVESGEALGFEQIDAEDEFDVIETEINEIGETDLFGD